MQPAPRPPEPRNGAPQLGRLEQLKFASEILQLYAQSLADLSGRLSSDFCDAVDLIWRSRGSVVTSGMGKAGLIAQKIAATLSSTGTRSHFLHPAEAIHGDLGRIHPDDLLLIFSQSGETEEIVRLLPSLAGLGVSLVAVTGRSESSLARSASVVLDLGRLPEACWLGLAPSTSTMAMLAVGDALALVLSRMRGFGSEDFARYHPGGSLGLQLSRVQDHMRPIEQCRVSSDSATVREVFVARSRPGRRSGAVMLLDHEGRLSGLFTDSDLARLFERRDEPSLDRPVREVMTRQPTTIGPQARLQEAVELLAGRKFSELPVIDDRGRPLGLIDITDVVGLPAQAAVATTPEKTRKAS